MKYFVAVALIMLDHVMIKGYQGVSIGFVGQFLAHLGLEFV